MSLIITDLGPTCSAPPIVTGVTGTRVEPPVFNPCPLSEATQKILLSDVHALPPPPPPVRVILSMIVRDESKIIGRCLKAAMPFIDGAVICDTGSLDNTPGTRA
jgi:hypothetical protein